MSELHIYVGGRLRAMISLQPRAADTFVAATPWLLLWNSGIVERFAKQSHARTYVAERLGPFVEIKRP